MLKKVKNFISECGNKMEKKIAPLSVAAAALGIAPTVYATDDEATVAITKIIEVVFKIFRYIGIVLALWGVGSLVLAFKNEDADSKSRAIMTLIVGICLVTLEVLFGDWLLGLL